ncbi:MAG: hypothetical protein U5J83_13535 [Bryobacterales bacterium]|nr:hypothetical protein [Bryobacterales bacterium]
MNNKDRREQAGFPDSLRAEGVAPGEQDAVWALLDEWQPGELSPGFDEAVLARIRREESPDAAKAGWVQGFVEWLKGLDGMRGLGLAGALATVVFAMVMLRGPVTVPADDPLQTATQELSAQQVEMALEDLRMLDELYNAPATEDKQNDKL